MNSIGRRRDGNRLAAAAADAVFAAYDAYQMRFRAITLRAKARFEQRDWHGAQQDATDRLALYKDQVHSALAVVHQLLGARAGDVPLWETVRCRYSERARDRDDEELAESFFNSVSRRAVGVIGVDHRVEYLSSEPGESCAIDEPVYRTYREREPTRTLVRRILRDFPWEPGYHDLDGDAAQVADAIDARVAELWGAGTIEAVDMLRSVFYRNKGAYLVGRIRRGDVAIPLVLPLLNSGAGIVVDAVLLTSDDASIVFGFSWSYFRAASRRPRALVDFLASIMPLKRIDELYTAIGYNKHGKTELYRSLAEHLQAPDAIFERTEGEEGLVMSVFTLPSFNVVFKIIKDTFGQPKKTTRKTVMEKYRLVFLHDRVGRLADAQEFEHLEVPRRCFSESLLTHLLSVAASTVRLDGDRVIIRHLYTERRVTPLDVYLREASESKAREAIVEYGTAIKDLAGANIFTGDMLHKNCGVSRHGRVIFYDYDELCLLTDCNIRRIPQASDIYDELSAEPWFYVGENDVFPEEFGAFLVPPGELRDAFLQAHADLLTVEFWQRMQERQRAGEILDVFPYRQSRRLVHAS